MARKMWTSKRARANLRSSIGSHKGKASSWLWIALAVAFVGLVVLTIYGSAGTSVGGSSSGVREQFADNSAPQLYKMIYVYSAACTYCKQFEPVWADFQKQVRAAGLNNVTLEKSTDAAKYNVKGFPTVLISVNGVNTVFEGQRTTSDLWDFLRAQMTS